MQRRVTRFRPGEFDDVEPHYLGGMVFRCNPDGSDFEVLGHNFRNNYEVAVDSFGNLWQSDNDDDGYRGVRINYVMEYGNYGYRDEMTAAAWAQPRTGQSEIVWERHWHQNDPGVVPNSVYLGAGSPTGITVYEGRLLPEVYWDRPLHADAGPGVVRGVATKKTGAGWSAEMVPLLGGEDRWARRSTSPWLPTERSTSATGTTRSSAGTVRPISIGAASSASRRPAIAASDPKSTSRLLPAPSRQ